MNAMGSWRMGALVLVATASIANADTFVIDDDGGVGVDFTQISTALASPLVADGDVLLVRPGTYFAGTITKAVTLHGTGATADEVLVNSLKLQGIAAGSSAHVSNLCTFTTTSALQCDGTVVYHGVEAQSLKVEDCADFRAYELTGPTVAQPGCQVRVTGSHVEISNSILQGQFESSDSALFVGPASFARVANCDLTGGTGYSASGAPGDEFGGPGGHGAWVVGELVASGDGNTFHGGYGGQAPGAPWNAGAGGNGIKVNNSAAARVSGVTFQGGGSDAGYLPVDVSVHPNGSLIEPSPPDPSFDHSGPIVAGASIQLEIVGEPMASAVIFVGANPQLVSAPNYFGELAVGPRKKLLGVGVLDATGRFELRVALPAGVPSTRVFYAQAATSGSAAPVVRLTNSVPLLFR